MLLTVFIQCFISFVKDNFQNFEVAVPNVLNADIMDSFIQRNRPAFEKEERRFFIDLKFFENIADGF